MRDGGYDDPSWLVTDWHQPRGMAGPSGSGISTAEATRHSAVVKAEVKAEAEPNLDKEE